MTTPTTIPLWDSPAPHSLGSAAIDVPTLTAYLPAPTAAPTPAMVICPGGGYGGLALNHEGATVAEFFRSRGVAAFILKYRLPVHGYRHPVPLLDVRRAVRLVRSRAPGWNIAPDKIGIIGFSAGGHLASTAITHFEPGDAKAADPVERAGSRPDYAVLVYPVVSFTAKCCHAGSRENLLGPQPDSALLEKLSNELQVTPQTPPTIFVHSVDDGPVPIENSRLMLAALQKAGVPTRLDEYPTGGHGYGYGYEPHQGVEPAGWLDRAYAWLQAQGFKS